MGTNKAAIVGCLLFWLAVLLQVPLSISEPTNQRQRARRQSFAPIPSETRAIVGPMYRPAPGQASYETSYAVQDPTYSNFYAHGKKNKIARLKDKLTPRDVSLTREALLKATSAQTSALVAAAQGARSSLEIAKLARKAESIAVNRATWALKSVKEAAKAEEVAVNAIQTLFV